MQYDDMRLIKRRLQKQNISNATIWVRRIGGAVDDWGSGSGVAVAHAATLALQAIVSPDDIGKIVTVDTYNYANGYFAIIGEPSTVIAKGSESFTYRAGQKLGKGLNYVEGGASAAGDFLTKIGRKI